MITATCLRCGTTRRATLSPDFVVADECVEAHEWSDGKGDIDTEAEDAFRRAVNEAYAAGLSSDFMVEVVDELDPHDGR